MAVRYRHVLEQGPVIAALGRTALAALTQRRNGANSDTARTPISTPGPEISAVLPPRSSELVRDYVRHVGGDPAAYRRTLPPHLFPQWGFGLAARTLVGLPYPLARVMNGGCRLEANAPLPSDQPLHVRARLESIDDNGERAILHQRIATGTADTPDLVVGHLFAYVPLARKETTKREGGERARPRVPDGARELAYFRIGPRAGLEFAVLTGDFNPVHWIPPYARSFGFRGTILHGFSTMARAWEGLVRARLAGDASALARMDVRFTRPLLLPARVGLYIDNQRVWVGDAPGGAAYLEGTFGLRSNE